MRKEGSPYLVRIEKIQNTGCAFDSLGYESFFTSQFGVHAPHKAWDVVRRAGAKSKFSKSLK